MHFVISFHFCSKQDTPTIYEMWHSLIGNMKILKIKEKKDLLATCTLWNLFELTSLKIWVSKIWDWIWCFDWKVVWFRLGLNCLIEWMMAKFGQCINLLVVAIVWLLKIEKRQKKKKIVLYIKFYLWLRLSKFIVDKHTYCFFRYGMAYWVPFVLSTYK